jgi:2-polyprenyl-3-methyl-5-hydroxy-6-metoxy-1,4-benzoquinol methylase
VTGSLAYRKNEAAILSGEVPSKYRRLLPHIPGQRIIEIGSAEGVLALLLTKQGKEVIALERSPERHETAQILRDAWGMEVSGPRFICGDIRDNLERLKGMDTLVAVRMIYYLGDALDMVFTAVAKHVPNVVLCGNGNRANKWRTGETSEGADNFYASLEGMTALLVRHGYEIASQVFDGDQIVVGRK